MAKYLQRGFIPLFTSHFPLTTTTTIFACKADDDTFLRLPLLVSSVLMSPLTPTKGLYYGQFCTGAPTRLVRTEKGRR
jgi:hypothetical protein